jgi:hypothetical protein
MRPLNLPRPALLLPVLALACVITDADDDGDGTTGGSAPTSDTSGSEAESSGPSGSTGVDTTDGGETGGADPIIVDCTTPLRGVTTWSDDPTRDVDYVVDCILPVPSGATLVAELGTVVEFGPGAGIAVDGGMLDLKGAEGQPVTLRAADPSAPWRGISIFGAVESRLDHARIEDAGAPGEITGAAILVGALSFGEGIASIRDCVIDGSVGYGISITQGSLTAFERNEITASAIAAEVSVDTVGQLVAGSLWSATDFYVDVRSVAQPDEAPKTWTALEVPYRIAGGVTLGGPATIEAGTHIEMFGADASLVTGNGTITAVGTPNGMIEIAGDGWNAVFVSSVGNTFQYVHFAGGSGAGNAGQEGMLTLDGNTSGTVSIRDCVFEGSAGWGVWLGTDGANADIDTANALSDNALGDVYRAFQ